MKGVMTSPMFPFQSQIKHGSKHIFQHDLNILKCNLFLRISSQACVIPRYPISSLRHDVDPESLTNCQTPGEAFYEPRESH